MTEQRKIKIGVIGENPEWTLLLNQIGVDWEAVATFNSFSPATFSILIIAISIESSVQQQLNEFAKNGGAVLYTKRASRKILNYVHKKEYRKSIAPENHKEYSFHELFDIYDEVFVFDNDLLVATEQLEKGIISFLGIDLSKIFRTNDSERKSFYATTNRLPHERVAKRSKNAARQFVQSHLEFLHHKISVPFIHKWYYPKNSPTLFTFRVDSDKGSQEQIDEIYRISEEHKIPTTWFLDVKSHEQWLDYFKKFSSQELGVHCYEHSIHNSEILNQENFEKAISILQSHPLKTHGIAAPTGAWSNAIGNVIQKLNFKFSSEFCYDYDNLPSFPFINSQFSHVVQLPIHPVCIGIMIREHMTSEEMITYYKQIIDTKFALCEPIALYHHPTHTHNEVFEEVFRYINSKNILKLSYSGYADWWKRREQFHFAAAFDGSVITIDTMQTDDIWLRISLPNNIETIRAPQASVRIDDQEWMQRIPPIRIPHDILRARAFNWRHYIQNFLDWWIKATE